MTLVEIRPATPITTPPPEPTMLEQHLAHFHRRVLIDALQEATGAYWDRRATQFADVGTPACDQVALACRRKAQITRDVGLDDEATQLIDTYTHEADAAWE